MGEIFDRAGVVYRDFAMDGVASSGPFQPPKADIRALMGVIESAIYGAQAGIETVPDLAARDAFYVAEGNRGKLCYVNNNNGSPDDPANGVYEYVDGGARIASGFYQGVATEAAAVASAAVATVGGRLDGLSAEVSIADPATWDADTRTLSMAGVAVKSRGATGSLTWTPAGGATWDVVFSVNGAQMLYIDTSKASTANPLVVGAAQAAIPEDGSHIPLAHYWQGDLTLMRAFPLVFVDRPAPNVQHVASNLPIVYVDTAGYGVAVGTWMVPITTRYALSGSGRNTINNAASTAVDPTGTYPWGQYAEVPGTSNIENSLYLDPGTGMVASVSRTTKLKGSKAGYVQLARYHGSGKQLTSLDGIRAIKVGKDPDLLFGRVAALEATSGGGGAAALPAISDGRRMRRTRAAIATLRTGTTLARRLKIVLLGDSWIDRMNFAAELLSRFGADGIGMAASGWISLSGLQQANGVTITWGGGSAAPGNGAPVAGWTYADGSYNDANRAAGYVSADGSALIATGTAASIAIAGIKASDIHLSYKDDDGTFRYRVDGGEWTVVAGGGTGAVLRVQVAAGLSLAGTHGVEIDTTGNAGTVTLAGIYATAASGSGAEVSKMGNGGSTAWNWSNWTAALGREMALIQPDLVVILLGTNDQRLSGTSGGGAVNNPTDFRTYIGNMIAAVRAVAPRADFALIGPPRNNAGTGTYPMADFGAALGTLAAGDGAIEVARFDQLWGDFAQEGPTGNDQFQDDFHLSQVVGNGAHRRFVGDFYDSWLRCYR